MPLPLPAKLLTGAFVTSGVIHLVRPRTFEPAVPTWLPAHRELVYASGVAELVCAAAMIYPATRKLGGLSSAALLVAVFPGNVQMAQDALATSNTPLKVGMLARLPLQVELVRIALRASRG